MSRCTGALGRRNIYGTVLAYTQQSLSIKGGGQGALRQEHASINPEVLHEPDTAVQQAAHETRLPALRIASLALTDAAPRAVARSLVQKTTDFQNLRKTRPTFSGCDVTCKNRRVPSEARRHKKTAETARVWIGVCMSESVL